MRTLTLAALAALTASFAAAPAFASSYGHNHGHSHGHGSHARSYGHGHVASYNSYKPTYRAPTYHAPTYHAPVYQAPVYYAPKYEAPKPTTSYETKPAYVYQKVAGYCTEKVVKNAYGHSHRTTVECKAGEIKKAEAPVEAAPEPVEPPK